MKIPVDRYVPAGDLLAIRANEVQIETVDRVMVSVKRERIRRAGWKKWWENFKGKQHAKN